MTTPDPLDRRHKIRTRCGGQLRWCAEGETGVARVLDVSSLGAALTVPQADALRMGTEVSLWIEPVPGQRVRLADRARVVHIGPRDCDTCRVCLQFDDPPVGEEPDPVGVDAADAL